MTRQTRLTNTKPLKGKKCPSCGKELDSIKLGVPGERKVYCSVNCIIVSRL